MVDVLRNVEMNEIEFSEELYLKNLEENTFKDDEQEGK